MERTVIVPSHHQIRRRNKRGRNFVPDTMFSRLSVTMRKAWLMSCFLKTHVAPGMYIANRKAKLSVSLTGKVISRLVGSLHYKHSV